MSRQTVSRRSPTASGIVVPQAEDPLPLASLRRLSLLPRFPIRVQVAGDPPLRRHALSAWLARAIGLGALLSGAGCAPAPDPARLWLGDRELVFAQGAVSFSGVGDENVLLKYRGSHDRGGSGLILDLQLTEAPGINVSRFAGKTYSSRVALGQPGFAFLRLVGSPAQGQVRQPNAGGVSRIEPVVIPVHELSVEVSASAVGNLKAVAEGVATLEGNQVPVRLRIEHY